MFSFRPTLSAFLLSLAILPASAHEHLAAGFKDTSNNGQPNQGEPLELFGGSISGGVNTRTYHLLAKAVGLRYGGYFSLDEQPRAQFADDYFSFIALSNGDFEIEDPNHAQTGSWLWMEITSVLGPVGAQFGFWDESWSFTHTTPTQSFTTNQPTGGFKFILSEGSDDPGQDPSGHIHNRGWTVDQPGEYFVGFTLYDLSSHWANGQPFHAPSQTYTFHFVAIPEPSTVALWMASSLLIGLRPRSRSRYAPH